jgi:hypothetical protein
VYTMGAYDQMVSMGYTIIVYTILCLRPNGLNGHTIIVYMILCLRPSGLNRVFDYCVYDFMLTAKRSQLLGAIKDLTHDRSYTRIDCMHDKIVWAQARIVYTTK